MSQGNNIGTAFIAVAGGGLAAFGLYEGAAFVSSGSPEGRFAIKLVAAFGGALLATEAGMTAARNLCKGESLMPVIMAGATGFVSGAIGGWNLADALVPEAVV